jgi:flagellar biosynthesis/type III secretory pathway protein FliH
MNFKRHLNKRIRLVEGTDPNATDTGMGGSEGSTGSAASTTQQEPTITQAQLDAIISRKLAKEREKLEAAQKAAEDARKLAEETEKRVNEAREKGISLGLLQAKRNAIAEQYGLSADLLPTEEDRLDAFEKQLAASINSRTRVTPVTVEPATKTPDWMGAAHA